ncbi:ParB N-terminal domain-containing protein [Streptomyces sp. bgisy153]|uniref:ParB/RepB/Spo0J family partition protein n=1 Tax=Streptomyces sp. bgisy153 TaxID=3413793 RepID=UPI003D7085A6
MTVAKNEQNTNAEDAYAGRFEMVDPLEFDPEGTGRIVIDPFNHRKKREEGDTTEPDPGLIASVGAIGVQQPIILRPQEDAGKLGVVIGQRRTKAARAAAEKAVAEGRPYLKIPAIIRDDLKGVNDEALAASMVENVHRAAASTQDDLEAAQQLALMVGAKRVPKARKTKLATAIGRTVEELDAAEKVAKIDRKVVEELDEDEVEFDWVELADYDEVKDVFGALDRLEDAKQQDEREGNRKRGAWRQAMQELRAEKEKDERIEATKAELAEKKHRIVEWQRRWEWTKGRPLDELVSAIGRPLTPQGHNETCEGHGAAIDPADGTVVWVCVDYKKHGHRIAGAPEPTETDNTEAIEEAAAKQEAEREDRRRVRLNNAAWRQVRSVRQDFITEMCQDKGEAPAHIKDWVMANLLTRAVPRGPLLTRFLGVDSISDDHTKAKEDINTLIKRTAARRYWWVLFANIAATYEHEHMKDDAWRGMPHYHYGYAKPGAIARPTAEWLRFLKSQGYTLSEIEQETLAQADREAEEQAKEEAERQRREAEREAERQRRAAEELSDEPDEDQAEPDEEPDGGAEDSDDEPGDGGAEDSDDEPGDGGAEDQAEPDEEPDGGAEDQAEDQAEESDDN